MSRTKRGGKAPGYEYWSRRMGGAPLPGRFNKRRTHKIERQQFVRALHELEDEMVISFTWLRGYRI